MPDGDILCKAKRLDNGEWVEGYYVHNAAGQHMMVGGCHDKSYIMTEVDPSTVCRYTGLPDKHGTEAFVGDIIRYQDTCRTIYGIIRFGMIPNSDNRRKDVGFLLNGRVTGQTCGVNGGVMTSGIGWDKTKTARSSATAGTTRSCCPRSREGRHETCR